MLKAIKSLFTTEVWDEANDPIHEKDASRRLAARREVTEDSTRYSYFKLREKILEMARQGILIDFWDIKDRKDIINRIWGTGKAPPEWAVNHLKQNVYDAGFINKNNENFKDHRNKLLSECNKYALAFISPWISSTTDFGRLEETVGKIYADNYVIYLSKMFRITWRKPL